MGFIFDFLGSIFGYILWFFFDVTSNYAIAITLFAIVINIIMFPTAIKRQKTMALNARLAGKQKEIQKRYGKDKQKYSEELAKLYEQEGANPMSGCFSSMILPLILWGGIFGSITRPLQNTLHISQDKISEATSVISSLPEMGDKVKGGYEQLQLVRFFDEIKPHLTMFNSDELADIEEYSSGFNLLGLNLLNRPNAVPFNEMLWIIPILCFIVSAFSMYVTQKMNGNTAQVEGAMKIMPYAMFIFTAYIAYTIPGAVGLYWILNSLIGMIQNLILNKYYNVFTLNAKDEATRFATLIEHDKKVIQIKDPKSITSADKVIPFNKKQSKKGK